MCKHEECPYKYCPYHREYDSTLEVVCEFVIPNTDFGDTYEDCTSYLDI